MTSISELADYCRQRDSIYYDGGIVAPTQSVTIGSREMLCSEGRLSDSPGQIYAIYDLKNGQAIVTICFNHLESAYGKASTRQRIEKLLGGIVLTEPQTSEP